MLHIAYLNTEVIFTGDSKQDLINKITASPHDIQNLEFIQQTDQSNANLLAALLCGGKYIVVAVDEVELANMLTEYEITLKEVTIIHCIELVPELRWSLVDLD